MSLIPRTCIEYEDSRRFCVASENGKKYQLENISKRVIRKVKADKCLPQQIGDMRCDFLMVCGELKTIYFIELKGGDLNKAVNQILSTIIYLEAEFEQYSINARIVGSRDVPGFRNTPDYKRLAKKVLPTGGTIERATNRFYSEIV